MTASRAHCQARLQVLSAGATAVRDQPQFHAGLARVRAAQAPRAVRPWWLAVLMAITQRALAHALKATEVSQSFVKGTRLSGLGAMLVWPYAAYTDVTVPAAFGLMLLVFATGSAVVASFIDNRMLAAPAVFVSGFFLCLFAPTFAFEITGVAIFGGMALGAQSWKWTDAAEARAS